MALTPFRWIALAVIGALVVGTMLLEARQDTRRPDDPRLLLAGRAAELNSAAAFAAERVRSMELHDSIIGSLRRAGSADTSRVLIDRGLQGWIGGALLGLALRTRDYRPARPQVPVELVFVLDTATRIHGVARVSRNLLTGSYFLPRQKGDPCVAIIHVRPNADYQTLRRYASWVFRRDFARRLLGPCAFVERFGNPGPAVDQWLMDGAWTYARQVRWDRSLSPWTSPWRSYELGDTGWPLRGFVSNDGFRCFSGDAETCQRLLTTPRRDRSNRRDIDVLSHAQIVSAASLSGYFDWRQVRLGPVEVGLLSDMVRDLGAAKFQRFWTSPEPVPVAFRGAAGRDLGDWVTEWAKTAYGENRRGPAVPPTDFALALGLVAVAAAGAGVAARRRQVT